jgi:hypothetical protein
MASSFAPPGPLAKQLAAAKAGMRKDYPIPENLRAVNH